MFTVSVFLMAPAPWYLLNSKKVKFKEYAYDPKSLWAFMISYEGKIMLNKKLDRLGIDYSLTPCKPKVKAESPKMFKDRRKFKLIPALPLPTLISAKLATHQKPFVSKNGKMDSFFL